MEGFRANGRGSLGPLRGRRMTSCLGLSLGRAILRGVSNELAVMRRLICGYIGIAEDAGTVERFLRLL